MTNSWLPEQTILVYCDGLCEPHNPGGFACWAWLAIGPNGNRLNSAYGCLGHGEGMTNNLAEYEAILQALRHTWQKRAVLIERRLNVEIRADSQLVVKQIDGSYRTNAPPLIPLRDEARRIADRLSGVGVPIQLRWIPRELNGQADALSRRAYDEATHQVYEDLL